MKKILCIFILLFSFQSFAKNNFTENMDQIYDELIRDHKHDIAYRHKVETARKKWHEFVKSQNDLMFSYHTGTMSYNCKEGYGHDLDRAVTNETKYLFYSEDGDSCSGVRDVN